MIRSIPCPDDDLCNYVRFRIQKVNFEHIIINYYVCELQIDASNHIYR